MTRRAAFKQHDVTRAIRAAVKAGLPPGSFSVEIHNGALRILPIAANQALDAAQDAEQRMREAFGE